MLTLGYCGTYYCDYVISRRRFIKFCVFMLGEAKPLRFYFWTCPVCSFSISHPVLPPKILIPNWNTAGYDLP